jgi:dihydrolipoamide dehydrogenase
MELASVPKSMVVIGGGMIGLELGSVWQRLGAQVTVIEFLDRILPGMDGELSKTALKILGKQGIQFKLGTKVTSAKTEGPQVALTFEAAAGGNAEKMRTDIVLLSIGRRPFTEGLGLEQAGVKLDDHKRVIVDGHFQTNVKGIYAIGDVIAGAMLAHKAEDEGIVCAEMIAGQSGHINYDAIPSVVYTWPEIASVGKTEEELIKAGVQYKTGKFPFTANARARAMAETEGFVKILADTRTDRVLGAHIIGPDAGTMIAELALAIEFSASSEDIARTSHAHPTLNEAVKEAALAVDGRPIHI